jgi:HTH-type transcriptional regulator/antitoxin HigA
MNNIHFSQEWATRVTSHDEPGITVSGKDVAELPSEEEIMTVLERVSETDAVREMIRRKWFEPSGFDEQTRGRTNALKEFLFSGAESPSISVAPLFRRQLRKRGVVELISTFAWLCRLSERAYEKEGLEFRSEDLQRSIGHLVRLSADKLGPRKAIRYLETLGVKVIIESTLPSMHVDGASLMLREIGPLIGLTLRYDRLDSFWFTLMHEVAHLVLHLKSKPGEVFVDTLEYGESFDSETEIEADAFAKDSFIPRDVWNRSDAFRLSTNASIIALSKQLKIHPAIVAGRLRFERKIYQEFSQFVGNGEVRALLMSE